MRRLWRFLIRFEPCLINEPPVVDGALLDTQTRVRPTTDLENDAGLNAEERTRELEKRVLVFPPGGADGRERLYVCAMYLKTEVRLYVCVMYLKTEVRLYVCAMYLKTEVN